VQIGDENVHRVRAVLDEVFGEDNSVALIHAQKTSSASSDLLPGVADYILWYSRKKEAVKYRALFRAKRAGEEGASKYDAVEDPTGVRRLLTTDEKRGASQIPAGHRFYAVGDLTSQRPPGSDPFSFQGETFVPAAGFWKN